MKSITVPAAKLDLSAVVDFVGEELDQYDASPKAQYQIEVALEEVLVNIASYSGLTGDEGVEVRCDITEDPLRATVQFLDGGVPFDPLAREDPDISPEALNEREGGLGIYLVKQMMDEVSYAYEEGKNVLTITKNLQ